MELHKGDCLDVMRRMDPNCVDAIVTDPPYGLEFMGKEWDKNLNHGPWAVEALRVAKPGCHLLAFGGTRTFHRLTCALEDAGWEIRDCLMWVYGSGFPKSHDVSKAIDKAAGAERKVISQNKHADRYPNGPGGVGFHGGPGEYSQVGRPPEPLTAPATDAARQWNGWGTALKPAWEPIILARKPLEGTVAENVQKWGTGAMNVDGGRIPANGDKLGGGGKSVDYDGWGKSLCGKTNPERSEHLGRWPANLIHDGSEEVLAGFPNTKSSDIFPHHTKGNDAHSSFGMKFITDRWNGDSGSAARFFYCAKASRAEREMGLGGMEDTDRPFGERLLAQCKVCGNKGLKPGAGKQFTCGHSDIEYVKTEYKKSGNVHPCVKPLALMRYLCRLVTPPNGLILDPFMGSGTTGMAAKQEGFRFIGIELDGEYHKIAEKRIAYVERNYQPQLGM